MAVSNNYPPSTFFFKVEIKGLSSDIRFQEVSGLSVTMETKAVMEGGENRYTHQLPVMPKYDRLVLKRGYAIGSELFDWCSQAIEELVIVPKDIDILLHNEIGEPLCHWQIVHAYPVKWAISNFNAMESSLAIETIELQYNFFRITRQQAAAASAPSASSFGLPNLF